jgi:predicted  nucleic acid-binding Zn-ribbon protein
MIQAAVAYDETQKRIASLEDKLNRAVAALEAKNLEIDNLNLLLSQERNRNDTHRNERDQAVADRAEVLAILSNVRAVLEKAEIPMRHLRKRKGGGSVVADNDGEQLAIEGGGQSSPERQLSNADASRATLAP